MKRNKMRLLLSISLKILAISFIFTVPFAVSSIAQVKTGETAVKEWITVQSDDKKLMVDFPADVIIDAATKKNGQLRRVIGFYNGVVMELTSYKKSSSNNFFGNFMPSASVSIKNFTKDDFKGLRRTSEDFTDYFTDIFYLTNNDSFYSIKIRAGKEKTAETERFLYAVKINDKPLFSNSKEQPKTSRVISLNSLMNSPETVEAINRKTKGSKGKVELVNVIPANLRPEFGEFSRPPILIEQPQISFTPRFENIPISGGKDFAAKVKVEFLANGEIGNIWVYSNSEKEFTNACVDVVKKSKFIPAQKKGINVDSFEVFEFTILTFSAPVNGFPPVRRN